MGQNNLLINKNSWIIIINKRQKNTFSIEWHRSAPSQQVIR